MTKQKNRNTYSFFCLLFFIYLWLFLDKIRSGKFRLKQSILASLKRKLFFKITSNFEQQILSPNLNFNHHTCLANRASWQIEGLLRNNGILA